jgi:hypothetical protein
MVSKMEIEDLEEENGTGRERWKNKTKKQKKKFAPRQRHDAWPRSAPTRESGSKEPFVNKICWRLTY